MRINQFVASATGLSRRAADAAITAGRVTIDGHPATLGEDTNPTADIHLDHQPLRLPTAHTLVMLNKPAGYVSSRAPQGTDPTLYELLPAEYHRLRIVGRLDRESSGLVLLTDDGAFIQTHTHPSFKKIKVYELKLGHPLAATDQHQLETGVMLTDGLSRLNILEASGRKLRVSLGEGRNRQIRRTLGALGYTVERLHRIQMGEYQLDNLAPGKWRIISSEGKS